MKGMVDMGLTPRQFLGPFRIPNIKVCTNQQRAAQIGHMKNRGLLKWRNFGTSFSTLNRNTLQENPS